MSLFCFSLFNSTFLHFFFKSIFVMFNLIRWFFFQQQRALYSYFCFHESVFSNKIMSIKISFSFLVALVGFFPCRGLQKITQKNRYKFFRFCLSKFFSVFIPGPHFRTSFSLLLRWIAQSLVISLDSAHTLLSNTKRIIKNGRLFDKIQKNIWKRNSIFYYQVVCSRCVE